MYHIILNKFLSVNFYHKFRRKQYILTRITYIADKSLHFPLNEPPDELYFHQFVTGHDRFHSLLIK